MRRPLTLREAFELRVWRGDEDECWPWPGYRDKDGYGRLQHGGRGLKAHRVSYEIHVGPIPEGLPIDHLCRNRACVNPVHLEPVTAKENTLRGVTSPAANAAKTHCKRGHEFTPENTRIRANGSRQCRLCQRERARQHREDNPERHRAAARASAATKRAADRDGYNAYMREYHRRARAAERQASV